MANSATITTDELIQRSPEAPFRRVWLAWNRGLPEHCFEERGRMVRRVSLLRRCRFLYNLPDYRTRAQS
jgi:hypothetical protein